MRLSGYLVGASIVSLAAAITGFDEECAPYSFHSTGYDDEIPFPYFNSTEETALFIRCAETTYECDPAIHGSAWFMIDNKTEAVPEDCYKEVYGLHPYDNYTGPISMPGLTELSGCGISGTYEYVGDTYEQVAVYPSNVTSVDLPDVVSIQSGIVIDNANSITSLNVPKLRDLVHLILNFTGGPPINLTFPRLYNVYAIEIYGEIDTLDFHSLNTTSTTIFVNSTGNLDCDAFAKSVVNTTSYYLEETGVSCTSKMGTVNLTHVEPPIPEVTSGAFKIQGGFLTMTALLGYILAL
ncbi:hypothetical protein ACLOAV_007302 [Pseudogymnoascus australis]